MVTIWSQSTCNVGWAEMIGKVYEVNPMLCPECGGTMKVVAFITDYQAVDRIIAQRLPSVTFLFLTSIRSQKYSFIVKGDTDSELSLREDISPKKTKFLSPNLLLNEDYCKEHINKGIHHGT